MVTLANRLFELVVLTTDVAADDLAQIQQCADAKKTRTVMLTRSHDASDGVHPVQPMPDLEGIRRSIICGTYQRVGEAYALLTR
jgi:hypothetical protein